MRPFLMLALHAGHSNSTLELLIPRRLDPCHLRLLMRFFWGLAAAGIGIGVLCYKHPEFVMGIVEKVFTAPGLEVGRVTPSSILVELYCYNEESFRSFMEDFEARKVQERLNKEFENSGYIGEELEVTITNYKEAEKFLEQFSRYAVALHLLPRYNHLKGRILFSDLESIINGGFVFSPG